VLIHTGGDGQLRRPRLFGGYVNQNFRAVSEALGWSRRDRHDRSQRNLGFADDTSREERSICGD